MGDGGDFDRVGGQVDAVAGQPVDDRAEGVPQCGLTDMFEAQPGAAIWRAATGFGLLDNGIGGDVAGCCIGAGIRGAVVVDELFHIAVQQPPPQLVAERVPHDRVHADKARGQMPDGKKLYEFHIDQRGAGIQRQRV